MDAFILAEFQMMHFRKSIARWFSADLFAMDRTHLSG